MNNKVLIFSNANELVKIHPTFVVYVESDGNYSVVHLCDKTECVFSINLSHVQQLIEEQLGYESAIFIRIGKQLIVNRSYIFKINPAKQQLIMLNNEQKQAFVLQASKEALKKLKDLIEKERG